MVFHIGSAMNPLLKFTITGLGFPKIRVNFNGYRLKTRTKDNNWSNFYHISENDY